MLVHCPGPVLKWPGGKWSSVNWLLQYLPPHDLYLETHFGSGALLFSKPPCGWEWINDIDGNVVRLYRVLRERPEELIRAMTLTPYAREEWEQAKQAPEEEGEVEQTRYFLVRHWQSLHYTTGGWRITRSANAAAASVWAGLPERLAFAARRLRAVHVECRPALEILGRYQDPRVLVYADPPYLRDTRGGDWYPQEMTDTDHQELLGALRAHPGPVMLSGYANSLYDEMLPDWTVARRKSRAVTAGERTEILWLNPATVGRLSQRSLFNLEEAP